MPIASGRPFGEKFYTLTNLVIAKYTAEDDSWETPVNMYGGTMFNIEPTADNDELREYGVIEDSLAVITGATLKFGGGGVDWAVMERIAVIDASVTGNSGERVRRVVGKAGGRGMGLFSAIGTAATTDGGVAVFGIRKVRLTNFPTMTLDGNENKFSRWEVEGKGLVTKLDDGSFEFFVHETYEDPLDWVAPTDSAGMSTFFNGA